MKAIRVSLKTPLNPSGQGKEFKIKDKNFIVNLNKKGQMKLSHISKKLGKGSFGEAFLIIGLNKGKEKVLKQARPDVGEAAKRDLANEFQKLTEIHAKGKVWGKSKQSLKKRSKSLTRTQ